MDETTVAASDTTLGNAVPDSTPDVPLVAGMPTDTSPSSTTTGPPSSTLTLDVHVVDGNGHPFPGGTSGVLTCKGGTYQTMCAADRSGRFVDADGDGHIQMTLQSGADYMLGAFASGTGWIPGWQDPNGNGFNFSEQVRIDVTGQGPKIRYSVSGNGADDFPVFRILRPATAVVRIVDGDGRAFPPGVGGVKACVIDNSGQCPVGNERWRIAHDDDGDGTLEIGLDPGVMYEVQGIANNSGWCNPWTGGGDTEWHFGNIISPVTADQLQGKLFVVSNPCPDTSTTAAAPTTAAASTTAESTSTTSTTVTSASETSTTATSTGATT